MNRNSLSPDQRETQPGPLTKALQSVVAGVARLENVTLSTDGVERLWNEIAAIRAEQREMIAKLEVLIDHRYETVETAHDDMPPPHDGHFTPEEAGLRIKKS